MWVIKRSFSLSQQPLALTKTVPTLTPHHCRSIICSKYLILCDYQLNLKRKTNMRCAVCLSTQHTPIKARVKGCFFLKRQQRYVNTCFLREARQLFRLVKTDTRNVDLNTVMGKVYIYTTQGVYAFKPFSLFCISFTVVLWNLPSCTSLAFGCLVFFLSLLSFFPVFPP